MTKRNLCDTCLHRHVCRHSTDPAGTAMVSCVHYERLILAGRKPGHLPLWIRTATPPEEDET